LKLLRHGLPGREEPGILDPAGHVRSLKGVVDDLAGEALSPESLARIAALDPMRLPLVRGPVRYGPCVAGTGKFICIGLNYADHAKETGAQVPSEPVIFMKATSAIQGPDDEVWIPRGSEKTDWEVELGVVIGSRAKHVSVEKALEHVAGYCVVHDLSERSFQLERKGQWSKGKGCDTFGPIGPWLVTKDEVKDPQDLHLWLDVDGRRMQDGNTRTMVYGVAFLVAYLSEFFSLLPGDVISTGTPPGVGFARNPPVFLRAGQTVRLGVDGLGVQTQRVVEEPA
jgi:2-keto-4-pentenoate hydratase/2-oxohepta-3-ene-1,7-dioic acid hydratase in catechol pathway